MAAMLEDALVQVPPSPVVLGSARNEEITLRPSPTLAVGSSAVTEVGEGAAAVGPAGTDIGEGCGHAGDGLGGETPPPRLASILAAACADVAGSQTQDADDEPILLSTASIEVVTSAAKRPPAAASSVSALRGVSLGLSERPASARAGERPGSRGQGRAAEGTPRPWGGPLQPSRGFGLGPVAQARACWAKWRRENKEAKLEAKVKMCGETMAVGKDGQRGVPSVPLRHGHAAPGAHEGLGLEIRGTAPPSRTPKVPRATGKA